MQNIWCNYFFVSAPSFFFFIESSIFCMVSLRHFSRYSSQVIHLFTSLSLFHSINSPAVALVIPVSFPDVKGALTPTVTTAFIDAVSTLGQVKKPTLTHKTFAINNRCRAEFLFFYAISKTVCAHSKRFGMPKTPSKNTIKNKRKRQLAPSKHDLHK